MTNSIVRRGLPAYISDVEQFRVFARLITLRSKVQILSSELSVKRYHDNKPKPPLQ